LRAARPRAALLAAACALFAACSPAARDRIVVAAQDLPSRLDPVTASTPAEENACELVFDGLVNIAANDSGSASPALGLADSIAQDQGDRALYRITLRAVRWQDGRFLDAEDVASSFAAYAEAANRSARRDYLIALVASVEADGPGRVLVRFREPIAEFRAWYVLAFKVVPRLYRGQAMPLDRSGAEGAAFAAAPIGTGPFRLMSMGKAELAFASYRNCYRGPPASGLLILRRIASSAERIQSLLKGKVDVIADTGPLDRSALERAGDVMVQSYMPHAFYAAALNTRSGTLSSVQARQALVRAVNRSALVPGLTDRAAGVDLNVGPFPDGLLTRVLPEYFRNGFADRLPFDPSLAARLASVSGIAASSAAKRLKIAAPSAWGELATRLASGLAAQLERSRIQAQVYILGSEAYREALATGGFDIALVYHEGYDNLYSGISDLYRSGSPGNETGLASAALDRLLARRDGAVEVKAWLDDTLALHDMVSELAPYIPLFTVEKDLFYRGVRGILIASDNPFLTAERWSPAASGG
jgi:peptide/nickel transport system substrate-binding protein